MLRGHGGAAVNRTLLRAYGAGPMSMAMQLGIGLVVGLALRGIGQGASTLTGFTLFWLTAGMLGTLHMRLHGVYPAELRALPVRPRDLWRAYICAWFLRLGCLSIGLLAGLSVLGPVYPRIWMVLPWVLLLALLSKLAISLREFQGARRPRKENEEDEQDADPLADDPNGPLVVFAGPLLIGLFAMSTLGETLGPAPVLAVCLAIGLWLYLRTPLPTDLDPPVWLRSKRPRAIQLLGAGPIPPRSAPIRGPDKAQSMAQSKVVRSENKAPLRPGRAPAATDRPFHLGRHLLGESLSSSLFAWASIAVLAAIGGTRVNIHLGVLLMLGYGLGCLRGRQALLEPLPVDRRVAFDWSIGLPLLVGLVCLLVPSLIPGFDGPPLGYRLTLHVALLWFGTAGWMEFHRPSAQGRGPVATGLGRCWVAALSLGGVWFVLTVAGEIASGLIPSFDSHTLSGMLPQLPVPTSSLARAALFPLACAGAALAWRDLRSRYRGVQLAD